MLRQLLDGPVAARLLMQRQKCTCQPRIAQGGNQAGSVAAGALDPTSNDHGGDHVGQSREDAGEADACGADLTFHGGENRHQPGVTLAAGINQHQARHQLAEAMEAAQFEFHASTEQKRGRHGAGIGSGGHRADGVAERLAVQKVDVLHGHLRMREQLMGRAMGDKDGVTGGQRIGCPVFHAQHRVADRQEVEPGMPGFGREAQAERRARLDAPVLDTAQAHAP